MLRIVIADEVREWVEGKLGFKVATPSWSLGIVRDDHLIGGVLYHNYTENNCEMTIATISSKWASRRVIRELLSYPFEYLKCRRITASTDANNTKSISMLNRLGFREEGIIREGSPLNNGIDLIIFGLLKKEFYNGKIST